MCGSGTYELRLLDNILTLLLGTRPQATKGA